MRWARAAAPPSISSSASGSTAGISRRASQFPARVRDLVRLEQHAYDRANYLRSDVSDDDRAYCAGLATKAKAMNYMVLNECYEGKLFIARNKAEMKALKEGPTPKFKY